MTPAAARIGLFIEGEERDGSERAAVTDPWDDGVIAEVAVAGRTEIEQATAAAVRGFRHTRSLSRAARSEILARAAALIDERREELAQTIRREAGKPISQARWEVVRCHNTFQLAAEETKRFTGEMLVADILPRYEGYQARWEPFPIGPVLGITPFNFPLNLVAHKMAPAFAAGNPVVVKPAPKTPLSALRLARILHEAGAPPGSVNVVPCPNDLAARLVTDERFRMLSFTGSARVGWTLKKDAGKKKVTLELGGNAALVVEADADLDLAAKKAAIGGFAYAGQACISVQRIYAHRSVYDELLRKLVKETESLGVGDTASDATVVGPLVSADTAGRVESWIREALREGARLVTGGERDGKVIRPAILVDVKPTMKVSCEELFGPAVTVEAFEDFEAVLAAVNASPFGLQAGIFTYDQRRIDRAFRTLEVGTVLVNETSYFRIDNYPYGGVKDSGFGREGVRYAMESMTEPRVLVVAPA